MTHFLRICSDSSISIVAFLSSVCSPTGSLCKRASCQQSSAVFQPQVEPMLGFLFFSRPQVAIARKRVVRNTTLLLLIAACSSDSSAPVFIADCGLALRVQP